VLRDALRFIPETVVYNKNKMHKTVQFLVLISFLFGCSKTERPEPNWDIDQFQDWLFKQKRIESEIIFEAIENYSTDKKTEPASIVLKTTYKCGDGSKVFMVMHDEENEIRYIEYLIDDIKRNSIEYFRNGVATGIFLRDSVGNRHGKYYCFHDDGSIRTEGEYEHGKDLKNQINYEEGEYWKE
jgi:hypothetical protein